VMAGRQALGCDSTARDAGWSERLREADVNGRMMNELIMDYLIVEGHKEAAECFRQESGTEAAVDLETVSERMAIRHAIESADLHRAVELVQKLDANLLTLYPDLHFRLKQLLMIEMIRAEHVEQAIEYAQRELAPLVESSQHLLPDLERTMMLLAYADPTSSPEAHFFSLEYRQQAANELNAAVLSAQGQHSESRLPMMLRMLQWAQDELSHHHNVPFPRIDDMIEAIPKLTSAELTREPA